jgi:hypothetical protein
MQKKDWKDKYLDKDLRIPGNKHYSPDACMFVTNRVNSQKQIDPRKYLDDHPYPQGVGSVPRETMPFIKYIAQIRIDGVQKRLGTFLTVDAASSEYCKEKAKYLRVLADSPDADCHLTKVKLVMWAELYELEIVYLRDNERWKPKHRQTLDSFFG